MVDHFGRKRQQTRPLFDTISDPGAVTWGTGTLTVTSPTLIASPGAATKVIDGVTVTNALTIEAWVSPSDIMQDGPARIVTLSQDPTHADFSIGQGYENTLPSTFISARLRTTTTNLYGEPLLWTYPGTLPSELTQIVYTRDASGAARVYVNGVEQASGTVDGDLSTWATAYRLAQPRRTGRCTLPIAYAISARVEHKWVASSVKFPYRTPDGTLTATF